MTKNIVIYLLELGTDSRNGWPQNNKNTITIRGHKHKSNNDRYYYAYSKNVPIYKKYHANMKKFGLAEGSVMVD